MNAIQEKIYKYLLDGISSGKFSEDERIPTENELGKMFDTNRLNAHYAVKQLERFGVLRRNKRQGTFVNRIPGLFALGEMCSLATRRICILNQCSRDIRHIHWNERIMTPLEEGLRQRRIEMVYRDMAETDDPAVYREILSGLIREGFNALLMITDSSRGGILVTHPELLLEFHHHVFVFDRGGQQWRDWPYNLITINTFGEGTMAAEYLCRSGCERFWFCGYEVKDRFWARERERGLCFGLLRETGGRLVPEVKSFDRYRDNPEFCRELMTALKSGGGRLAVVACNDEMGAAILSEVATHGLEAPRDFALLSFDDNVKFREFNLTTVAPALEKIGTRIAAMIGDNIDHECGGETWCVKVDSSLVPRGTA